jgi:predicted aspartyl protease
MRRVGETRIFVDLQNAAHPERRKRVKAVIDTGAMVNWLPEPLVSELGLQQIDTLEVRYADGRKEERPVCGPLLLTISGRRTVTDAVSGPPRTGALVSVVTLERLDLLVDPVEQCVKPRHPKHPKGLLPVR